jgi:RimJ/RimL family protein N-acetyltransferase
MFEGTSLEPDVINWMWEQVKRQDYAFDDLSRNDPTSFCLALQAPQTQHFFIGEPNQTPVGWCIIKGLYKHSNPEIHFVVWDPHYPLSKIKAAGREVLSWIFKTWQCNRVTGAIPQFNDQAKRFALMLRFQHEGTLKQAVLYHGRWVDVQLFGLLKENFYKNFEVQ